MRKLRPITDSEKLFVFLEGRVREAALQHMVFASALAPTIRLAANDGAISKLEPPTAT